MGLTRTEMKTRWIAEGISGCLDFRRQTPAGATDTFLVAILFLRQHCVDGVRTVARHFSCSSGCGEYESLESRQSVRADRARERLLDNDRALPRKRDDYPWNLLRSFLLCRGASAQYVATDHHGERSVWWSWDFSSIGKGKRVFPPRRMISLKRSSVYLMTGPI